jgi:hypothetical protein
MPPEDDLPTIEELLIENRRLRQELSLCQLDPKGEARRVLALETQRDCFVKNLLEAASSPKVSVEVIMDFMVEATVTLHNEEAHVVLYEVRPLTGRTLGWIKENEHLDGLDGISKTEVLFIRRDSAMEEAGRSLDDLPRSQRYLSMKQGTVVADAFFRREPVVSLPPDGEDEGVDHVRYGTYDKSRWRQADQRAAFPVINPLSRQVEFVLALDKFGRRLNYYDIRYVRDFVNLGAFALVIKQIMAEDRRLLDNVRKGLHDLASATQAITQLGGLMGDLLETPQPDSARLHSYNERLAWQFARFSRLVRDLRSGAYSYDLRPRSLDDLVASFIGNVSQRGLYGDRVNYCLDLADGGQPVLVDAFVMQAALENMARNTFETGRPARVHIATRPVEGGVKLSYYDDCGGMDEALYQGILERGRAKTTKALGSGLGIQSILKTLRDMDCIVGAVNLPGQGLGYDVVIPLAQGGQGYTKQVEM